MTNRSNHETTTGPILELRDLEKQFASSTNILEEVKNRLTGSERSPVRAVDNVDLSIQQNQVQGIIGESGCGKSTLLELMMGMQEPTKGEIRIGNKSISEFDGSDWKEYRQKVQIIFQNPFDAINPTFTVRETLYEPLRIHNIDADDRRILNVLEQVQLLPPEDYIDRREGQLSGGEKQRVSIARALMLEPDIILADEPVSMLDVSTQMAVLQLLQRLTNELGVSMVYVSHDLSTVSYICDVVNVMYLGRIVETATTAELLENPMHPYTQALIQAIPIPDPHYDREQTELKGTPSDSKNLPEGCRFKTRCPERMDVCDITPRYTKAEGDPHHRVACHLHYEHDPTSETDKIVRNTGTSQVSKQKPDEEDQLS